MKGFLLWLLLSLSCKAKGSISAIVETIDNVRKSHEILLLSHFKDKKAPQHYAFETIHNQEVPLTHMSLSELRDKMTGIKEMEQRCDIIPSLARMGPTVYGVHIYNKERLKLLRAKSSRPKTLVIWGDDEYFEEVAWQLLELSTIKCVEVLDLGLLHTNNWIFLLSDQLLGGSGNDTLRHRHLMSTTFLPAEPSELPRVILKRLGGHESERDREVIISLRNHEELKELMKQPIYFPGGLLRTIRSPKPAPLCLPVEMHLRGLMGEDDIIVKIVADKMGTEIEYTAGNGNGALFKSGNWTDDFRLLLEEKIDLLTCGRIHFWDREQVFTGSFPLDEWTWFGFVAPLPQPYREATAILEPFPPLLWLLLFISWIIYAIVQAFIVKYEPRMERNDLQSTNESIWYCFGILAGESLSINYDFSRAEALRLLMGTWMAYSFLMGAGYSGLLRSLLTSPKWSPEINTWSDAINANENIQVVIHPMYKNMVKNPFSNDEQFNLLMSRTQLTTSNDLETELKLVMKGERIRLEWYGDLLHEVNTRFILPNGQFSVHLGKSALDKNRLNWFHHKQSPFAKTMVELTKNLFETGCVQKIKTKATTALTFDKLMNGMVRHTIIDSPTIYPMNLTDFQGLFWLFGLGLPFSIIIFLLEKFCFRKRTKRSLKEGN